jgi:outer membrane receptor for ferrienterochelin and colicins
MSLLALLVGTSRAAPGGDPLLVPIRDIEELSLSDLLGMQTTTATKSARTTRETPAMVTVIQGEEIRAAGYTSVAEVLRTVPGLYDLYDQVGHNMGVRGVNGGARAFGNVLQVRIDDQAVPMRFNTGNLLGEELVPIEAIERIEVLRGPASALYGANAFLGVIHIVTRQGAEVDGAQVTGRFGVVRGFPGGGLSLVLGGGAEDLDVMVSAQGMKIERSEQALPGSSPVLSDEPGLSTERSERDLSRPQSLLARATLGDIDRHGQFGLWASVQQLDAMSELQDVAPMSHGTRIALRNQHYRLSWKLEPQHWVSMQAWGTVFDTRPTRNMHVDIGTPDQLLLPNISSRGHEVGAEMRIEAADELTITLGGESIREYHQMQGYSTLLLEDVVTVDGLTLRDQGSVLPGAGMEDDVAMSTVAGYGQLEAKLAAGLRATGGTRLDKHTVYGLQLSPRVGLVFAPEQAPWSLKVLYGSSFKAPSAEQLYGYPMEDFDIRGNSSLEEQRAQTAELGGTYDLGRYGALLGGAFVTGTAGRVEYLQHGLFLSAKNAVSEVHVGGELEAHLQLSELVRLRLGMGVAQPVVQSRADVMLGQSFSSPYPAWQVHVVPTVSGTRAGLRLQPEISLIGPRPASQSNTLQAIEPYEMPTAVQTGLSLGWERLPLLRPAPASLSVRVTDLFDSQPADPGFGGVDYPGLGRQAWLTLSVEL